MDYGDEVTLIRFRKREGPRRQTGRLILTTSVNSLLPRSSLSSCVSFCMLLQTHARGGTLKKANLVVSIESRRQQTASVKQTNKTFQLMLRENIFAQVSNLSQIVWCGLRPLRLCLQDWKMWCALAPSFPFTLEFFAHLASVINNQDRNQDSLMTALLSDGMGRTETHSNIQIVSVPFVANLKLFSSMLRGGETSEIINFSTKPRSVLFCRWQQGKKSLNRFFLNILCAIIRQPRS